MQMPLKLADEVPAAGAAVIGDLKDRQQRGLERRNYLSPGPQNCHYLVVESGSEMYKSWHWLEYRWPILAIAINDGEGPSSHVLFPAPDIACVQFVYIWHLPIRAAQESVPDPLDLAFGVTPCHQF